MSQIVRAEIGSIASIPFSDSTRDYLITTGLPERIAWFKFDCLAKSIDRVSDDILRQLIGNAWEHYYVIGTNEVESSFVCIDVSNDELVYISTSAGVQVSYLNRNIRVFWECLSAYESIVEDGPDAFTRNELAARDSELRAEFRRIDETIFRASSSFWVRVLKEMKTGFFG